MQDKNRKNVFPSSKAPFISLNAKLHQTCLACFVLSSPKTVSSWPIAIIIVRPSPPSSLLDPGMAQVVQNKSSSLAGASSSAQCSRGGRRNGMDVAKLEGAKANPQAPSLARIFMNLPFGRRRRGRYLILFVRPFDHKRAAQFVFCKK